MSSPPDDRERQKRLEGLRDEQQEGRTTAADLAWIADAYVALLDDAVRDDLWR